MLDILSGFCSFVMYYLRERSYAVRRKEIATSAFGLLDRKGNIYVTEGDGMRIQIFAPKK